MATGILAAPELAFALSPDAQNDEYSTPEDTTLTLIGSGVLDNDTDAENDSLTAVLDSTTTNGILVLNADGSFEYTPNADFSGTDSFSYYANDDADDSNIATVTIQVNPQDSDSIIDLILEQIQMLFDKIFVIEDDVAELKEQNAALESRVAELEATMSSVSSHSDDDDHTHDKKQKHDKKHKHDKKIHKEEIKVLKKEYKEKQKMLKDEYKELEHELKDHDHDEP